MRVGIVCEGPTDFFAIRHFIGSALSAEGIGCEIIGVQPAMDNTRPVGGWVNVLSWLENNTPEVRALTYFGSGLFVTSPRSCDALLFQMDSDILECELFKKYVSEKFGYDVSAPTGAHDRAEEIRNILKIAARFPDMTEADANKHVLSPAVESTENWCVAAFTMPTKDFETLSGQALIDAFMSALQRFEGDVPNPPYAKIDKSKKRREKFCSAHSGFHARVADGCPQFRLACNHLIGLAP